MTAVSYTHLDVYKRQDGDSVYLAEAALHLGEEDVAPDHALAALAAQILEGGEIFRGEHLAGEDGDGLVREVEALHLDGCLLDTS